MLQSHDLVLADFKGFSHKTRRSLPGEDVARCRREEINNPYRETITSTPKGARIGEQMGS